MHAYPAAYGGFSDIWDCRLNHEQKPPERVRSPGVNPCGRYSLLGQVAVKVIRPIIANEKQRQVKEKVTFRSRSFVVISLLILLS